MAKRIGLELKNIRKDDELKTISAGPISEKNMFVWEATILGPQDSVYQDGIFKLNIRFPDNYPFRPPTIDFCTQIFHPNIGESGSICLDILSGSWSPILTISKVLLSISSLLTDPNPADPLNGEAGNLYLDDRDEFDKKAKQWTITYASNKSTLNKKSTKI
jgi:ubiquitin-conjugating enzyme E2 D